MQRQCSDDGDMKAMDRCQSVSSPGPSPVSRMRNIERVRNKTTNKNSSRLSGESFNFVCALFDALCREDENCDDVMLESATITQAISFHLNYINSHQDISSGVAASDIKFLSLLLVEIPKHQHNHNLRFGDFLMAVNKSAAVVQTAIKKQLGDNDAEPVLAWDCVEALGSLLSGVDDDEFVQLLNTNSEHLICSLFDVLGPSEEDRTIESNVLKNVIKQVQADVVTDPDTRLFCHEFLDLFPQTNNDHGGEKAFPETMDLSQLSSMVQGTIASLSNKHPAFECNSGPQESTQSSHGIVHDKRITCALKRLLQQACARNESLARMRSGDDTYNPHATRALLHVPLVSATQAQRQQHCQPNFGHFASHPAKAST
eukprot:c2609_g1_i1.p1 GENE.c2609_g1_i1~~c2609_g1_i1.p1  ORF type:complete len:382 (-),score=89.03 c2609_g1_i1:247-1362(-)